MNKMRFVRDSMGMTQFQLGKLTNIRPNRISYFENGWAMPTLEEAKVIAEILGVHPAELLEKVRLDYSKI